MSPLRHRRSLASRVTILAGLAVGLTVAIMAFAAFVTVQAQMYSSLDESLLERAKVSATEETLDAMLGFTVQRMPAEAAGAADVRLVFVSSDGRYRRIFDSARVPLSETERAVVRGEVASSRRTMTTRTGAFRVVAVPTEGRRRGALVIAQSLAPTEQTLERLRLVLTLFGALGVVGATFAGWLVARSGLRPVRRLTLAAEDIARTEQLSPIAVEGKDEIARLASAFNAMLAALAGSRDRQRQLVADAGHELRTPLTSLRTNVDLLVQADRRGGLSDQARAELLADVRFQIEELTTLVGDLVELARDEPPPPTTVEAVDLAEIVDRALARVRRRASSLEFVVHTSPWWVTGEPASLERAVTNLLDNAVKWSPPLGVVTVELTGGALLVSDEGEGIAEEDLPHVFDRFYRSRASRSMPGSGLGLAIVRQVAERHGGSVRAGRSNTGGAAFWFTVPGTAHPDGVEQGEWTSPPTIARTPPTARR